MFRLRNAERAALQQHIADLKEEVHWLRSCIPWVAPVGSTAAAVGASAPPPIASLQPLNEEDDLPDPTRNALSPLSEEEEDVLDAFKRGELDEEEAKAILKVLGHTAEIDFK